jgi:3-oxoacyl-[acyl-carrier protein] reductase
MDLGISGRVAIVAGASTGIGYAVTEELQVNGVSVVVAARDAVRLQIAERSLLQHRSGNRSRGQAKNDCQLQA